MIQPHVTRTSSPSRPHRPHLVHALSWFALLCGISLGVWGCQTEGMQYPSQASGNDSGRDDTPTQREDEVRDLLDQTPDFEAAPEAATARSFVSVTDEVWIIAAPPRGGDVNPQPAAVSPDTDDLPGSGSMLALIPRDTTGDDRATPRTAEYDRVPMPLRHTEVAARLDGFLASVDVTQHFENPYDTKIEAVYVFPLPERAAVSGFVMKIGDRTIRGIIREREEAEQIYADARAQGYNAALMTQERANIFTQRVANIEPGTGIDVELTYFETLGYSDGTYRFVFPMVVGPRYHAPTGDAAARTVGHNQGNRPGPAALANRGEGTSADVNPQYLRPDQRSSHDISLRVEVSPAVEVRAMRSLQHRITQTAGEGGGVVVALTEGDTIPNRDFILEYQVGGDTVQSDLLITRGSDSTAYFTLMLHPPTSQAAARSLGAQPLELVFVIDASGSMKGGPMDQVKRAVKTALDRLEPGDAFQIVAFSDSARALSKSPLAASAENLRRGVKFVDDLEADGGTQMIRGVKAALDQRAGDDAGRSRDGFRVVTFFTDGFISNEAEILQAVADHAGDTRVFSVGVGTSVNHHLISRMARLGRGASTVLSGGDDAVAVMDLYMKRVRRPAMADLTIDWGGLVVGEVYPKQLPDLFVGRPVVVTGSIRGPINPGAMPKVSVKGRTGDGSPLEMTLGARLVDLPALEKVWARRKIADLYESQLATRDPDGKLAKAIQDTALRHGLMSAYTAFLAVDASRPTAGNHAVSVEQAVPVPDGVRYETAGERR